MFWRNTAYFDSLFLGLLRKLVNIFFIGLISCKGCNISQTLPDGKQVFRHVCVHTFYCARFISVYCIPTNECIWKESSPIIWKNSQHPKQSSTSRLSTTMSEKNCKKKKNDTKKETEERIKERTWCEKTRMRPNMFATRDEEETRIYPKSFTALSLSFCSSISCSPVRSPTLIVPLLLQLLCPSHSLALPFFFSIYKGC